MQIQITLEPGQEATHELAEVLRAFAKEYETWMIRSIKTGRHTLHDEAGALIASLEIVKGGSEGARTMLLNGSPSHYRGSAWSQVVSRAPS